MTPKKRAVQLARLTGELTRAEHRERRRIAKILHDHMQQILVSARFSLEVLEGRVDEDTWQPIRKGIDLIIESLDASRSLAVDLSPPVLHESGLIEALKWLTRWMHEKQNLTVELVKDGECNFFLPEDVKILLFSSVRELLLNVVKHASVWDARIDVSCPNTQRIRIMVSDGGTGFEPDRSGNESDLLSSGFGIFSIQERLQLIGGKCRITSAPGKGTTVTLMAPVQEIAAKKSGARSRGGAPPDSGEPLLIENQTEEKRDGNIRVLLADDHDIVRQGLSALLSDHADIEIVGEAPNGEVAVELARKLNPDVILMDISMPKMNGIEATRIIHSENPGINIIGLSMFEAADQAMAIKEAGARAYLMKSGDKNELLQNIRTMTHPA